MNYIENLKNKTPFILENKLFNNQIDNSIFDFENVEDAEQRLARFSSYLQKAFSELKDSNGIIESPILQILNYKKDDNINGNIFLKLDSHLPISGSIKARGGIYEVLKFAESIAIKEGYLTLDDDYSIIYSDRFKELFHKYTISVGSTGNLGLSIGIISAKLGFKVVVHMSSDAKEWKKELLRQKGVTVIEYPDDYEEAVKNGRNQAENDPFCYFVDDENSKDLFAGYSVAGKRLKHQLKECNINFDQNNPLNIYLPCGVGGAPGGVGFGSRLYLGENIRIIFVEPVSSPCFALSTCTQLGSEISIKDIGLDGRTVADGLAVGRSSGLVYENVKNILFACITVDDEDLLNSVKNLYNDEGIFLEPSACAGFVALNMMEKYLKERNLPIGNHLVWATGGNMVPLSEKEEYLK